MISKLKVTAIGGFFVGVSLLSGCVGYVSPSGGVYYSSGYRGGYRSSSYNRRNCRRVRYRTQCSGHHPRRCYRVKQTYYAC